MSEELDKIIKKQSKLNNIITLKKPSKGNLLFQSSQNGSYTKIPPLNAVINTKFGKSPDSKKSKLFKSSAPNKNIQFFNWASINENSIDDPNIYIKNKLKNFKIGKVQNQLCCGACWSVSTASCFSERYAIVNDILPKQGNAISIMSCCTKKQYKNVFARVETPDCDVMSDYENLKSKYDTIGMCSGGIPYSAGMSIKRNGLPVDSGLNYGEKLFKCSNSPTTVSLNKSIIDAYPCKKNLFEGTQIMKMAKSNPIYISSALDSKGHPERYVEMIKNALMDGPVVAGFVVMGDFLGMGTESGSIGSSSKGKNSVLDWNTTGKVYVPGAYDNLWPEISLNSVGGSGILEVIPGLDKPSMLKDKETAPKSSPGTIFCGFHAVVIVGWGELDMKYVENKSVKSVKSTIDGKEKLPFWICRNSWGTEWPNKDGVPYYKGGIKVIAGGKSKEYTLDIPPGYWLHAMYPNESLALDAPINYEGTDYGSTMVMEALKEKQLNTSENIQVSILDKIVNSVTSIPKLVQSLTSKKDWKDKNGYTCSDYKNQLWCIDGVQGVGWNTKWGKIEDYADSNGVSAFDICETCKYILKEDKLSTSEPVLEEKNKSEIFTIILFISLFIILSILCILLIYTK